MDSIDLTDIALDVRIGITEEERRLPQRLLASVEIFHPTGPTATSDSLVDGIDYAKVADAILALQATERNTVERLAEDIADVILKEYAPEGGVKVRVQKFPLPSLRSASVTIVRP